MRTNLAGKTAERWGRWAVGAMAILAVGAAQGQFHNGNAPGQTVPSANGTAMATGAGGPTIYRGDRQSAGMIDTGSVDGAKLVYTDFRNAVVWGRAIYHSDDSYTESKLDDETRSLTQETKSPNGVTLMKRLISLDANGNPSEIMIYDGRGQYRYRGQILRDYQGRFSEEQIFDTNGQLLRRTIQEYDPTGKALPLKVVDDLAKIPADLKLVITQADGVGQDGKKAQENYQRFLEEAREVTPGSSANTAAAEPAAGQAEPGKKAGFFKRFFGTKD